MARSPIPDLIERFHQMTEEERKVFLDLVDPQPEPEPAAKQTRKKRTTKSAKAQSLSSAISKSPKVDADADARCVAQVPGLDVLCGEREEALIHDPKGGYASYHPFVPPAQTAEKKSRRKAAAANNTPNTEIEKGAATGASGD